MTDKLLLRKHILTSHFPSFIHKSFNTINPGIEFLDNWHIDLIANYLKQVEQGKIKRLIINVPPRALKSIIVNVAWPAWLLAQNPKSRIISASYSQALSNKHSLDCKLILNSDWFQELFPETKLSSNQNQKSKFLTTMQGHRIATSVGGTLTGEGGDYLIIDDPHNPTYVYQQKYRTKIINWFEQTFASRLNDKKKGAIVLVMQRLHVEDLAGYLINKSSSNWEVLNLPAISNQKQIFKIDDKIIEREAGSYLHQEREGYEEIMRAKAELGDLGFSAQYLQRPLMQEGAIIKKDWLKTTNSLVDQFDSIYQSWDTAIKAGISNDYSVCSTWGCLNDQFYLIDILRIKVEYPELKKEIIKNYEKWQPDSVLIEDKASGQSLIQDIKRETILPIISIKPKLDKVSRMLAVTPLFESGRITIFKKFWYEDLLNELLAFPNVVHDDQIDSITQFLNWKKFNIKNEIGLRII